MSPRSNRRMRRFSILAALGLMTAFSSVVRAVRSVRVRSGRAR